MEEVDPRDNSFSPAMSCFALGKGSQNKMVPNKMFLFLSPSDVFICKFPRQLCGLSKISACIQ